ncbi:flagellin lysine-N-methylase [Clostridium sp. BJN0001]|uniref:flagellin lysine-N-methylase n=1 Tax=Clostridium sp. BJN0001 TaxID=2930219 RepID=UPI001FD4E3F5|nr:flagellin lysine-N-methylase [Clostridium sp. BJN0001]
MITKVPYYYKDFKCIASECTDTCCAGWEIVIDSDTYKKYKNVTSDFKKTLDENITKYEDGEKGFKLINERCAFLNDDNLCEIYKNLGKDSLCYTCRMYPRFTEEYGNRREIGLSLSCMEAARLILKDENKVTFESNEDDEMVTAYNDIQFEEYIELMPSRKVAIKIAQDRSLSIDDRIFILLNFASLIQEKIDAHTLSDIKSIRKNFSNDEYIKKLLSKHNNKEKNISKYNLLKLYIKYFTSLDNLDSKWPYKLKDSINNLHQNLTESEYNKKYLEFDKYYKDKSYEFEHLLVYFIYRYFLKSLFDDILLSKVKFMAVSYLIIKELDINRWLKNNMEFSLDDQIEVMHRYSKEIEHSEENIDNLYSSFDENEIFKNEILFDLF